MATNKARKARQELRAKLINLGNAFHTPLEMLPTLREKHQMAASKVVDALPKTLSEAPSIPWSVVRKEQIALEKLARKANPKRDKPVSTEPVSTSGKAGLKRQR